VFSPPEGATELGIKGFLATVTNFFFLGIFFEAIPHLHVLCWKGSASEWCFLEREADSVALKAPHALRNRVRCVCMFRRADGQTRVLLVILEDLLDLDTPFLAQFARLVQMSRFLVATAHQFRLLLAYFYVTDFAL